LCFTKQDSAWNGSAESAIGHFRQWLICTTGNRVLLNAVLEFDGRSNA
jgi:hypothetical protein